MDFLYNNIGRKIMIMAFVIAIIGTVASVVMGVWMIITSPKLILGAVWMIAGGGFFSWTGTFVLYGVGKLIDSTETTTWYVYQVAKKLDVETSRD